MLLPVSLGRSSTPLCLGVPGLCGCHHHPSHLHPGLAAPTGAELLEMPGEMPVAVEGKQLWQQQKGKMLFFILPLTFFRRGAAGCFNNREQSGADKLKYTLVFSVVLGGEFEFLATKMKCSGFESLTLPTTSYQKVNHFGKSLQKHLAFG